MKKKVIATATIVLGLAVPAFAILGLGDLVYDPTNFAEAVNEFTELEQQYAQLVQTYQMIKSQYDQMLWMAKPVPVNMLLRYRALATPWIPSSATNTYGTTAAWSSAVNTGQGIPAGYAAATEPLSAYGSALGNVPDDQIERLEKDYGTVELTDGANQSAIEVIGQLRANSSEVEAAISNLEADSLSSDPEMNTEIAVLNKINAASVIHLRSQQDANKLLTALAEREVLSAKQERDAQARAFNEHIQFTSQEQAVLASQTANASGAMLAWRMP